MELALELEHLGEEHLPGPHHHLPGPGLPRGRLHALAPGRPGVQPLRDVPRHREEGQRDALPRLHGPVLHRRRVAPQVAAQPGAGHLPPQPGALRAEVRRGGQRAQVLAGQAGGTGWWAGPARRGRRAARRPPPGSGGWCRTSRRPRTACRTRPPRRRAPRRGRAPPGTARPGGRWWPAAAPRRARRTRRSPRFPFFAAGPAAAAGLRERSISSATPTEVGCGSRRTRPARSMARPGPSSSAPVAPRRVSKPCTTPAPPAWLESCTRERR